MLLAIFTVTNLNDSGAGSLRQAVVDANVNGAGTDSVQFQTGLRGTIALTTGELLVSGSLFIVGPGADTISVSGSGVSRVFRFGLGSSGLQGISIVDGNAGAGSGGGVFVDLGAGVVASGISISGCLASSGGGVASSGSFIISNSTLPENVATGVGGGIRSGGSCSIINSTIAGNSASNGGGIYTDVGVTLDIANSTISGNSASSSGGGGLASFGTTTARSVLLAGNLAAGLPGDVQGTFAPDSNNNLVQSSGASGGLTNGVGANIVGVDPKLLALDHYGGRTRTVALSWDSPAIGMGSNPTALENDQRGGPFLRGTAVDIGAFQSQTINLVVDTLADVDNGDYSPGNVSLREAIAAAGPNPGDDGVTFASALDNGTINLGGTELAVRGDVRITGPGATRLTISAGTLSRVISFAAGESRLSGLTLTGGYSAGNGGGIFNDAGSNLRLSWVVLSGNSALNGSGIYSAGSLTISDSSITGNSSLNGGVGGGVFVGAGTLVMDSSTISGNSAAAGAGGLMNAGSLEAFNSTFSGNSITVAGDGGGISNSGTLTLLNSTVAGNTTTAGGNGAGIHNTGTLAIGNSTIAWNTTGAPGSGAGVWNSGSFFARSSIIAKNSASSVPKDVFGSATADSTHNLIMDAGTSGGLTNGVNSNIVGADPLLSPLANNGGRTQTVAIGALSPAIGKGFNPLGLTNDQRGGPFVRGAAVDIGAYQRQTLALVVDTLSDVDNGGFAPKDLSLREAIGLANANPGADAITFAPTLNNGTVTLGGTQLTISGDLTLTGPGAARLTVSGNDLSRVLNFGSGTYSLSGVRVTSGRSSEHGGGILNAGTLSIADAIISGNTADGSGGGIYSSGTLVIANSTISGNRSNFEFGGGVRTTGTLTLTNSTISGNFADQRGGGVDATGGLTAAGTTISGNSTLGSGGGIFVADHVSVITTSTISGNSAYDGGGIVNSAVMTISRSTVSANRSDGHGGGISNYADSLTVANATLFGNSAFGFGGGIYNTSVLSVSSSTVVGNDSETEGGGIFTSTTTTTLRSSIISGNTLGADPSDLYGGFPGAANNLIGSAATSAGLTNGVNGNIVGADPKLGPLASNGGPTQTMALLAGSPAINKGVNSGSLTTDQRGLARVRGAGIDIGAFEYAATPVIGSVTRSATSIFRGQPVTFTVVATDADGTVAQVRFFADLNGNGVLNAGEPELLPADANGADGFKLTLASTLGLPLGLYSILAQAADNDGLLSTPLGSSTTVLNLVPTIASLSPSTATLENGDPLTVTAGTVADADGSIASVSFYADTNANGVADAGELLGADSNASGGFTLTITSAKTLALPSGVVTFLAVATDNNGGTSAPRSGTATLTLDAADQFIQTYNAAPKAASGLVDGDAIATTLKDSVTNVVTSDAYWGARNHWFQDKKGDVWALWQGGDVHLSPTLAGQHQWVLTNLTDAAGLSGSMQLAPGSLSGVTTGWNAFNIQGIQDGKLVAIWWSPAGSAGTYVDTDGSTKQGGAWGLRGNGWSLSSISDALTPIGGAITTPAALFLPYSQSQSNGRTEFDPRPSFVTANTGMSVIVVDANQRVYAITFSVSQRALTGSRPDLNATWLIEPFAEVPSLADFGLASQVPGFAQAYVAAAND